METHEDMQIMKEKIKGDDSPILYIGFEDVVAICDTIDTVEIMRELFVLHGSNRTILPDEAYLGWEISSGESVRSLNMPGYIGGSFNTAGTKIINSNPRNPQHGMPRASGLTMLFDTTTTRILSIMSAEHISSLRTASISALGVDLLAGGDIETMAVIGAGVLARAHISLLSKRLPQLRRVLVFDTVMSRASHLCESFAGVRDAGLIVEAVESAEKAIQASQLIIPCTTVTEGYITLDWLRPGALLINVSLDDVCADVALGIERLIVDDWNLVRNDPRRLLGRLYRDGRLRGPDATSNMAAGIRAVDAELSDIVLGRRPGRVDESQRIMMNPFGLAIEDIAIASHVYRIALKRGCGIMLER